MFTGGRNFVHAPPVFSNDAKRILVCSGNTVSVFSTLTGLQTCELEGHRAQVTSVIVVPASTPASKILCYCWTASLDGKIKYWDFSAPELMRTIDIVLPIQSMVIPGFLNQTSEIKGKLPDIFAYVCVKDVKKKQKGTNSLVGNIRKCNLTKSRLVGGLTLAETQGAGFITVSPSGKYIGFSEKRKLKIWEIPDSESDNVVYKKIRLHHTKSLCALAFHPTDRIVAAGDVTGRILIWRGVGYQTFSALSNGGINTCNDKPGVRDNDEAESCTTLHWHSTQVNVLFFSSDGAYLYSGGREGVLVVWQLDTAIKKFLPRIGSPLLHYINSPDPTLSSISCADNRIHLLRMPSMEILRSISGIKLPSSMEMYEGCASGIVFNDSSGLIAIPTENYRLQFYSLFDDREISELQICERNHQPGEEITVKVNFVALSLDGSTMATVETRLAEEGIGSLVSLKFWECNSQSKIFSLSTVIYEPHREAGISSIAFRPTSHMAVSSSHGGNFKVWVDRHEISSKGHEVQKFCWECHAVGSYKRKPMTAAAFSGDGSVLAVAAEKSITLWDPDKNTLLAVIGDKVGQISSLSFVGKSNYLVSASRGSSPQLSVWSMSKLCKSWSYRLDVESVACSMDNSTFAVLAVHKPSTNLDSSETTLKGVKGVILIFNAENPVASCTWLVSKAQGGRISFIRSRTKSEDEVAETKAADELLAYLNADHEYVLFNPFAKQGSNLSISWQRNFSNLEETERFGYTSIYGELPEFSLSTHQPPAPWVTADNTWKTIFSGPSHSLPPLPKLCSDFLESLLERRSTMVE